MSGANVSPLNANDTGRILADLRWKPCASQSLQEFCRRRWGRPLGDPEQLDAWPEWQMALTSEFALDDIINAAIELTIVPNRNEMILPQTSYYSLGEGVFAVLEATNNRIADREELRRLYHDTERSGRSTVVTGQPGSGKTFYLYYCLLRRLSLGKPVILSPSPKEWFLFTRWGVWHTTKFATTLNDDTKHQYRLIVTPGTWALVEGDTRANKQNVEHQLWVDYLDVTTVLVTLPHAGRYDNWLRSLRPPLLRIINPACFEEVVQGCRLLHNGADPPRFRTAPHTREAFENLVRFMTVFGPAENNCLRSFMISFTDAVSQLRREIGTVDFDVLQKIFASLERTSQTIPRSASMEGLFSLDSDESYKMAVNSIAIISPRSVEQDDAIENDTIGLDIASAWVFHELLRVFILKNTDHVREFIDLCTRHSHTKALAGYFFETVIHTVLADARSDWRDRCRLVEFFPCGKSAHLLYNRYPLRRGHIFNRKRTIETYKRDLPEFDLTTYCQPLAKNNPTFDSILFAAESDADPDEGAFERLPPQPQSPVSPSSRKTRSMPRKDSVEKKTRSLPRNSARSPATSPRQSSFAMPSSSSLGKGRVEQQLWQGQNSLSSGFAFAPPPLSSRSGYRARSPSAASFSGMSNVLSAGQSSPPASTAGSDTMTARGYSPVTVQSMRERPRPSPGLSSVLGRKRQRPASVADSRPAKVARLEVPDTNKHFVAMQMTVGQKHTWNEKGVRLLRRAFEEDGNWHFVIVTHKRSTLDLEALGNSLKAESSAPFFRWYHLTLDFATTAWEDVDFSVLDEDEEELDAEDDADDGTD